jgi:acetyl esterase/lipase
MRRSHFTLASAALASAALATALLAPAALASLWHQPAKLPERTQVRSDLAYGADPAQAIDVYSMPGAGASRPLIVMVHGGAWVAGDKEYRGVVQGKAAHWLPRGYVFVSVNYRMLPQQDVAGEADDVARALAFVQRHAREWGGDPAHLTLMGHSAGAHLVALLSADPSRAARMGAQRWNATVALDSAALDVTAIMNRRHLGLYDDAFGSDPATWRALSPIHQLTRQAIPVLAVCSTLRPDHPCEQAQDYTARARALGIDGEVLPQELSHDEVNKELGAEENYTAAVDRFMAAHARGGSPARAR